MLTSGLVLQNRYQLHQQLSDRPACQTWLATDLQTAPQQTKQVVVKLLAVGAKWDDLKLFEREAQVLQQLNHPRIPQYRDYFQIDDPTLWVGLVETYIPGLSLKVQLDQGRRFTETDVCAIAEQILEILQYLHTLTPPVLHRDLKPSNLILTADNQVHLVDFGAVQDTLAAKGSTFTVVGTYGYTPMEQFGGQAVSASDLYALGATLIQLLTGVAPADLLQQDLRLQFRDRVTVSAALAQWLEQMTDPALAHRFNNAQQALDALKQAQSPPPAILKAAQPRQTSIAIHQSSAELEIAVPQRWAGESLAWPERLLILSITLGPLLTLFPLGIWFVLSALKILDFAGIGAGLLLSVFGSVPSLVGCYWLKQNFSATRIRLTPDVLTIQFQVCGWTFRQRQWPIAMIEKIDVLPVGPTDTVVALDLGNQIKTFTIAVELRPAERQWLLQTINDWLNCDGAQAKVAKLQQLDR